MYRILLTRGKDAYAVECDHEFDEESSWEDNMFCENIKEFTNSGDVLVLMDDLDDFETYFSDYTLLVN